MRKQKTVTIEGLQYELSQLGAVEGRRLAILFAKLFSGLLGSVAPLVAKAKGDSEGKTSPLESLLDSDAVEAIGEALDRIDPAQLEPLWEAFGKSAWVRGKDDKTRECVHEVFDEHFAGEYYAMSLFFVESAKLNFADFLGKALASLSASQSTDPTP